MTFYKLIRIVYKFLSLILLFVFCVEPVFALNPYFYIDGDSSIGGDNHTWYLRMDTADQSIGAFQVAMDYDTDYFNSIQINTQNSVCSMWSAMDSVPPGESLSRVTPYFYNGKLLMSCGITGAGVNSSEALILAFTLKPIKLGSTTFSFSEPNLYLNGDSITPGASDIHTVTIISLEVTVSATPAPTSSAVVTTSTLFSDVTFQQWNPTTRSSGSSSTVGSNTSQLEAVELDNTVPPPPPDMTPRPSKKPKILADMLNVEAATESGEVKAIQSLRDLLIPGKSDADKTVVLINFLSTITFLIILAIILWRMMMNSRTAKLKSEYINELISGELSALESKMDIVEEKTGKDRFEQEFEKSVQHILEEVNPKDKKEAKETIEQIKPK